MVDIRGLSKSYGKLHVLNECHLTIPKGCVFGLLGPNGAGKTTLIRILLGFLRPTAGEAFIDGLHCVNQSVAIRQRTSYLPAEAKLFRSMRGRGVVEFFSRIHPAGDHHRALELADRLQLALNRRVAFMSTGMRQKLAIVCVLSQQTQLVILDEPTANLDPTIRGEILDLIQEARTAGRTVLFSSHVLSEIEEVCDYAAIMMDGRIVRHVRLSDIRRCHCVELTTPTPLTAEQLNIPTALVSQVKIIAQKESHFVLHLHGDLEKHLNWLNDLRPIGLRIEAVGLRALYDESSHDHASGD